MKLLLTMLFLFTLTNAKYLSNESCKECHSKIYDEYKSSKHSKSYFNDILHKKVANKVSTKKYDCAICHMPSANNLQDLVNGKARPNKQNITHSDAISCYFCHTIAYVKKSHKFFLNVKAKEVEGMKPSLYGTLKNPDHNDKHDSLNNPIYTKNVCKGCHAFKKNDFNTTIFRAMRDNDSATSCIKCHMPKVSGGNEDVNRRFRKMHHSHKFLGIEDKEFRKKGIDINITNRKNEIVIRLKNKMAHPLIIQPARTKYLKIELIRDKKIIWQNYKNKPQEDKRGYFAYFFKKGKKDIVIPYLATKTWSNNLDANETKILKYKTPELKKGDMIKVKFFIKISKDSCIKAIDLNQSLYKKELVKEVDKLVELNK